MHEGVDPDVFSADEYAMMMARHEQDMGGYPGGDYMGGGGIDDMMMGGGAGGYGGGGQYGGGNMRTSFDPGY